MKRRMKRKSGVMKRWLHTMAVALLGTCTAMGMPTDTIRLQLWPDTIVGLEEVVVSGHKTPAANSRWSDMQPVELVTTGGANGDLYKALQTLPGTQVQGETGLLLVRGGSNEETQTYIDGMHVLKPYTSTGINSAARSRYSTFMFSGVNLASGGAPQEYGEALSAVLPLETKDYSRVNKVGVNASIVGAGGGGTRVLPKGSLSADLNFQDIALHERLFPGRKEYDTPYRMYSAAAQYRYTPDESTVLKVYAQYDRTDFAVHEEMSGPSRLFDLGEDNLYLNATLRRPVGKGSWNWMAGAACSWNRQGIEGASLPGDAWTEEQREWHLKTKLSGRLSSRLRLEGGMESYLRRYEYSYRTSETMHREHVSPVVGAAFLSLACYPLESLKAEVSGRAEYTAPNRRAEFSPRLSLSYYCGDFMFSAVAGRYTQLPANDCLLRQPDLPSSVCLQYNLGLQYEREGRYGKAELYYKDYDRLPLYDAASAALTDLDMESEHSALWATSLTAEGYGHSRGIDLFFRDRATLPNLEYQLSYSYNLTHRKYRAYREMTTPQYATRHNAAFTLKYSLPRLRTIIGLTDRFSSGRPFHNPDLPGLMNDEVKPYNSLDLGLTFLPSRKVIIHASATNILGRRNEFGRTNGRPVLASSDHFFYIGVFLTLGKKAAYDVSNF